MSKITQIFNLGVTQAQIDFVDIDISRDTPLFIDPHFIAHKSELKEKESRGDKTDLKDFTLQHPQIFKNFKIAKNEPSQSITNRELEDVSIEGIVDHLITQLKLLPKGNDDANNYESLMLGVLELLFYPDLICPQKQVKIHDGRKRIDITFDNAACSGSFFEFHSIHQLPCPYIMVECKNYTKDPKNPELDQLSGRFSPNRGKIGILVFRDVNNMKNLIARCRDTYKDDRGLIIPLCDVDIILGLEALKTSSRRPLDNLLRTRGREIQLS